MSREGSRTALVVQNPTEQRDGSALSELSGALAAAPPAGTLRLRGAPRDGPRVAWDEAVVDNEGLGRKKSKICCIYHRPRRFDESSEEEGSSEEDPSSGDDGGARPSGEYAGRRRGRHRHVDGESEGKHKGEVRNAYERMSPHKGKGKTN